MSTGLIYDERFIAHDTGPGHPERPNRLRSIVKELRDSGLWDRLAHLPFEPASREQIERLHDPAYVQRCFDACAEGKGWIDTPDSAICPASAEIAQLAVGGALAAVDAVMSGAVVNAFCAMRPPGHHAEADRSMGFCLFCNVALAADHLAREHGLERIAIVDFDVHHGNGTQHLLEDRADALFISLHEDPLHLYPGTGFSTEHGKGPGEGYTLNIPMPPGAGDDAFEAMFNGHVLPRLNDYAPQFVLVSAGFDAAGADPLAHLNVTTNGFRWMTRQLLGVAQRHANGRLVSMLEGGYDLDALSQGVAGHLEELLIASA